MIDDLNLECCDLIHLDIEGYELHALMGARNTIEKHQPLIVLEYYEPWAKRYNTSLIEIESFLSNCGYVFLEDCYGDRIYHYVGKIVHE
jgi:hypothetical protein